MKSLLSATTLSIRLAACLAIACSPAAGQDASAQALTQSQSIESVIDSLAEAEALSRGVPGIAVAVVSDGKIVLQRGYGVADGTSGRKATDTTPFNIASVTKPFTAAVVQMLIAEKRIDPDAPAHNYLPLPVAYRAITVRHLLTHTSGIARDLRRDNNDDPDPAEYRKRLDASQPSSPPGTRFEYSNTGFTVLGWLVEAVEGKPLEEVYRRRIFDPLGMRQARYRAPFADDPTRARPYELAEGAARPAVAITGGFASGGLSLSAADFAAFAVGIQEEKLLSAAQLDVAWTPGQLADGRPAPVRLNSENDGYGFGWFLTRYEGHRLMTHGGGITGYSANLYHFPDLRLTIAVLANVKGRDDGAAPVDPLARRIASACIQRFASAQSPAERKEE